MKEKPDFKPDEENDSQDGLPEEMQGLKLIEKKPEQAPDSDENQDSEKPVQEKDMDPRRRKQLIEAALFMAPRMLHFFELKRIVFISSDDKLVELLNELRAQYENSGSGIDIVINDETRSAGMRPGAELLQEVRGFAVDSEFRESVKRTLALIAYLQPAKQSVVARYRGNKAYDHIKHLLEKGLIKKERKGSTFILSTTKKFLDYFNLSKAKKETHGQAWNKTI